MFPSISSDRMAPKIIAAASATAIALIVIARLAFDDARPDADVRAAASEQPRILPDASRSDSTHFEIHSTASAEQTALVTRAVEQLHSAYIANFPAFTAGQHRLVLVLYRDRDQFKQNNR